MPKQRKVGRLVLIVFGFLVLAALALAGLIGPAIGDAKSAGIAMKTKVDVTSIATAVSVFEREFTRYPTNLNELSSNSSGVVFISFRQRKPKGTNDGAFLDHWMRRYVYVAPSSGSTGYVASFGRDGVVGGVEENADHYAALPVSD